MGAIISTVKNLDLYRKVPRDISEPTVSGALVSIVSTVLMLVLFISELQSFLRIKTESEMHIDPVDHENDMLQINLDIDIFKMPCEILSLDAQDILGSHEADIHGDLLKHRTAKDGSLLDESGQQLHGSRMSPNGGQQIPGMHLPYAYSVEDLDKIKKMVVDEEGCKIKGSVKVHKVPGNIHISTHSHAHVLGLLYPSWQRIDISHRVNHLSYGDDDDIAYVKQNFAQTGIVSPLDGVTKMQPEQHEDPVIFEYYVKVVPTTFFDSLKNVTRHVFQFTANSNTITNPQMPSIYIRHDLSPVRVKFTLYRGSVFNFLVQVCAIIGGVFTVAGIFEAILHRSVLHIAKKARIGKLG
eukprot:GDKI01036842.1.p1 GENE.GDKI01036842.1~~GDKI01036842.1.p1  ORF type:complete len:354 (-),score=106.93 GDKI01036842.1:285-1346(-)